MSELDTASSDAPQPPPPPDLPEPVGEPEEAPEATAETADAPSTDDDAEPEAPHDPEGSQERETPDGSEHPEDAEDPEKREAPEDPEAPQEPDDPDAAEEAQEPDDADEPDAPEEPEEAQESDERSDPEAPEAPEEASEAVGEDGDVDAMEEPATPGDDVEREFDVPDGDQGDDEGESDGDAHSDDDESDEEERPAAEATSDREIQESPDEVEDDEPSGAPDAVPEGDAENDLDGAEEAVASDRAEEEEPEGPGGEVGADDDGERPGRAPEAAKAEPEADAHVPEGDADLLRADANDDQGVAAGASEGDPRDGTDDIAGSDEVDGPVGENRSEYALEREEGPEGGVFGRWRDALSLGDRANDTAVDKHATVDRPDFPEETRKGKYEYGTPLDGPDGKRTPLFDGPPRREQAQQGSLGDCGIISAMGAVAGHRPESISERIRENGDGTYEVTLHQTKRSRYGDWSHFEPTGAMAVLTVTPDLPVLAASPDRPAYAKSGVGDAAWVPILEKAIAGVDATWGDEHFKSSAEGYSRLDRGSFPNHRAELLTQLTGEPAYTDDFPTQYDMDGRSPDRQLIDTLRGKLAEGCPVLVGTVNLKLEDERDLPKGLIDGHAYEVTEVDGRGQIHLRNPHNKSHPDPLTLDEFRENIKNRYTTIGQI
ncbi:C2 family cysteine protease [Streptomyces sp. NPDC057939]|uniref:C2 family cysteine protease n=1 Tax=Streptomyces sp. NPDC057939 TaxID=3346284 RepID=UPI0036E492BA